MLIDQVALKQLAVLLTGFEALHIGVNGRYVHGGGELEAYGQAVVILRQRPVLHDKGRFGRLVTAPALGGNFVHQHMEIGIGRLGAFFPVLLDFDVQLGIFQPLIVLAVISVDLDSDALLPVEPDSQVDQPPPHRASHFSL